MDTTLSTEKSMTETIAVGRQCQPIEGKGHAARPEVDDADGLARLAGHVRPFPIMTHRHPLGFGAGDLPSGLSAMPRAPTAMFLMTCRCPNR
jgi:hypothetical protein